MNDYLVRHSKKAKHLQLRLSPRGLEVIVPAKKRVSAAFIEQFILEKQPWINRHSQRFNHLYSEKLLPNTIRLIAIAEQWEVKYLQTKSRLTLHENLNKEITLIGDISDEASCLLKIKHWLMQKAAQHLAMELEATAQETNLPYVKFSVRNNTTRWGSCSSKGHIRLCCKLMFIPPLLVRHVIIHELCHTKVMNHSQAFWRLFEQFDPAARANAKQLRVAAKQVPAWLSL